MTKGLLLLLAVFCVLVGLLVWAKSRPAPLSASIQQPAMDAIAPQTLNLRHVWPT
ncbi:hypothetical protein BDE40_0140 [Litoreibacter halocynthiae]|uniref:Uncharacterized protein n=1 Tax=Litoreibacter halocynthiae TaxID=1242689 RepID=A0A4R7LLP0_9RHOB|nr:hypothetical protein BDE40_0140 [Litoreibacter halocynthiae]